MILSAICKKHAQQVNFSKAKKIVPVQSVQFVVFLKNLRVADIFLIVYLHQFQARVSLPILISAEVFVLRTNRYTDINSRTMF